jgi:hypothetical protein
MPSKLEKMRAVIAYMREMGEEIPADLLLDIAKLEAKQTIQELNYEDGKDGAQGLKGDKGDKGAKGDKGDKGDRGDPGKTGLDGKTPVKGKDYFDGKTPVKGKDYFDGKDGKDGRDGAIAGGIVSISGGGGGGGITALTGDVTAAGPGSAAATIALKAVTLAKMDDMATASLIYRKSALAGPPEVNSLATLKTDLGSMPANDHDIIGALHTVTGAAGSLVGLSALNTLGLIAPTTFAPAVLVDTRVNILATAATSGKIALSNDEPAIYFGDGSHWNRTPILMGKLDAVQDMGALPNNDTSGYSFSGIDKKVLSSSVVGEYTDTAKEGGIRQNYAIKKLEAYLNGSWKRIIVMSPADESEIFYYTHERVNSDYEILNHMAMQFGRYDIGAIPSDYILDGGTE